MVADQLVREREALEADLKALNDDLKQAASENRATIQQDIERVKKQIKAIQEQAKARLVQAKAETEARVKALQDQAKAATGRSKARIEKRIADARADFEVRSTKLSQAWALTKERSPHSECAQVDLAAPTFGARSQDRPASSTAGKIAEWLDYEAFDLVGYNIRGNGRWHLSRHTASPDIAKASSQ